MGLERRAGSKLHVHPLVVLGLFAMAGAIVLLRIPLRSILPVVVVLACPLMMLTLHRGHSGHGSNSGSRYLGARPPMDGLGRGPGGDASDEPPDPHAGHG